MDRKIGIIAQDMAMKNKVISLFPEEVSTGNIYIELMDPDRIKVQGLEMVQQRDLDVLIARSGAYRFAKDRVSVPVFHLKITAMDVLYAIDKAKYLNRKIVVVLWNGFRFRMTDWRALVGEEAEVAFFSEQDEIEAIIDRVKSENEKTVIVGGTIPIKIAKEKGMDTVFVNASDESIQEIVARAYETSESIYQEKYGSEVLRTILEQIQDAVLTVNQQGLIKECNDRALDLLGKERDALVGRELAWVLPKLTFMVDVFDGAEEIENKIMRINGHTVTASVSRIMVDDSVPAVVLTFQDITKLQKLEKRIRQKMNQKGLVARYTFEDVITTADCMVETVKKAKIIGKDDNTVIIQGESGTGKEMIAQSIHNISRRKNDPFVAVNCGAISESLLESELFGYEEGAFTGARKGGKPGLFELAHGGTLFLDEINSLSLNLQVKLLRVIEEKEVMRLGSDYVIPLDVRVISAVNEDLRNMVTEGSFRRDLFYRLCILELHLPPLRQRKEDIIPLFGKFLQDMDDGLGVHEVTKAIEDQLMAYDWPGNVRELRNIARRYSIFEEVEIKTEKGEVQYIEKDDLIGGVIDLKNINRVVERRIIEMLLDSGMGKNEAAQMLGISRTALWKRLKNE